MPRSRSRSAPRGWPADKAPTSDLLDVDRVCPRGPCYCREFELAHGLPVAFHADSGLGEGCVSTA
jgi:hypothetical protein